ncbi:MAG: hypothetical protein ACREFC_05170 [Stellaceae bacterium]
MTWLDPAIHDFLWLGRNPLQDVDARIKTGQGELGLVLTLTITRLASD